MSMNPSAVTWIVSAVCLAVAAWIGRIIIGIWQWDEERWK